MSIEDNKRTVRKFFESLNGNAFDEAFALMAPDAVWWIPTDQWGGTTFTKKDMQGTVGSFFSLFVEPPVFEYGRMTAEGDRVCLEMNCRGGRTRGGYLYGNDYHVLVQLRDGRIAEVREYMNPILSGPVSAELAG